jgi:RNAse (barnase) inhibitor barstar
VKKASSSRAYPTLCSLLESEQKTIEVGISIRRFAWTRPQTRDKLLRSLRKVVDHGEVSDSDSFQEKLDWSSSSPDYYGVFNDGLWDALCPYWERGCTCSVNDNEQDTTLRRKHTANLLLTARQAISETGIGFDIRVSNFTEGLVPSAIENWQDVHITVAKRR